MVPRIDESLRRALQTLYSGQTFVLPVFLRFGSWVGGDRDGHPDVTTYVTRATLRRVRQKAISLHLAECRRMYDFLSLSTRGMQVPQTLEARLNETLARFPTLAKQLAPPPQSSSIVGFWPW